MKKLQCILFLLVVALAISINSQESRATDFGVGIRILGLQLNYSGTAQNSTPIANGTNISVAIPFSYVGSGLQNITMGYPASWDKITNIFLNETGTIKSTVVSGGQISFEVNLSAPSNSLVFDAAPPYITKISLYQGPDRFQENLTIESYNGFLNASANVWVNTSYRNFVLFWYNGSGFADKTGNFDFRMSGSNASFSNFHTSTVLFMINADACVESWACTGWSDARNCGVRTCEDLNSCGTIASKPSLLETCPAAEAAGGTGGGGGGGGARLIAPILKAPRLPELNLGISPAQLKFTLLPGESKSAAFTATNIGEQQLKLNLAIEGLTSIRNGIALNNSYLTIAAGDSASTRITVKTDSSTEPGTYSGRVRIYSNGIEAFADVLVEIIPLKDLFATTIHVNPKTKSILPGNSVIVDASVTNLFSPQEFQPVLLYGIKDSQDNILASRQESLTVITKNDVTGILDVPASAEPGKYYAFARLSLINQTVGVASDTFEVTTALAVGPGAAPSSNLAFIVILSAFILVIVLALISVIELAAHHRPHRLVLTHGLPVIAKKKEKKQKQVAVPPPIPPPEIRMPKKQVSQEQPAPAVDTAGIEQKKFGTLSSQIIAQLQEGNRLLQKGDFADAESSYSLIKQEFEALPPGFDEQKRDIKGQILGFYRKTENFGTVVAGRFKAYEEKIMANLAKTEKLVKEEKLEDAVKSYNELESLYQRLPEGFPKEKAMLQEKILQWYIRINSIYRLKSSIFGKSASKPADTKKSSVLDMRQEIEKELKSLQKRYADRLISSKEFMEDKYRLENELENLGEVQK
jgi:hypothetical protein